jgi:YfiH family protein
MIPKLTFEQFDRYGETVAHAIFTRRGGVSAAPFDSLNVSYSVGDDWEAIARNRGRCAAALDLPHRSLTTAGLVHGIAVGRLESAPTRPLPDGTRIVDSVDALITSAPGQGLLITAADCLHVLLLDPATPAIGLVHAGWRGLAAGTIGATLSAMMDAYGSRPGTMLAGIGPGLGPCCAEFTDPRRELPASFAPYIQGRYVDLWAAARDQIHAGGVPTQQVEQVSLCTRCHRDKFFSHRGDNGRTGRFGAIIALRSALNQGVLT